MRAEVASLPSLAFEAVRPAAGATPLRTDVAMFIGSPRRGPVGEAVRIDGWRSFVARFGGLSRTMPIGHAVRGYFDNGGDVAWIWRLGRADGFGIAATVWDVGTAAEAAALGFPAQSFAVAAASPGRWGDGLRVTLRLQRRTSPPHRLDLVIEAPDEPAEIIRGVAVDADLAASIAARSSRITLAAIGAVPAGAGPAGAITRGWTLPPFSGGADPVADAAAHDSALDAVRDLSEPALYAFPDLHGALPAAAAHAVLATAAAMFVTSLDRLLIVDLPEAIDSAAAADAWLAGLGDPGPLLDCAAAYHPWLQVADPLAPAAAPLRRLAPSGHVAGLISRLDRDRGISATPANSALEAVSDTARALGAPVQAELLQRGINPIVCQSGRGLVVWGGRTIGGTGVPTDRGSGFIAHRRLMHRLVRAVRETARPLAFDNNGPVLWYALARGATTVLLEAWQARALKGLRPDEAFRVTCDASINTAAVVDRGMVLCEIAFAPAVPMEFITIRIALSSDGRIEAAA